ncbi:MAG: type I-C CRISPR-associated endonuclease Cas1 [Epulopiscium sp.]|jgi:CRISPR-associated protein Cas1|nr:type I-C CRISPR-associated endonuclease Cas1 [Candidatus Epulonipiscium sp.]
MRKLLNTIYITSSGMGMSKEGETIVFKKGSQKVAQFPSHNIESIVIFAPVTITPELMNMCSSKDIKISFISYSGKYLVSIQNPIKGNVRLRRKHYRISDDKNVCLDISKSFIIGKIFNCRCVLQRLIRDHKETINSEKVNKVVNSLAISIKNIDKVKDLDSLRGVEGEAAKNYYSVFSELIFRSEFKERFNGRSRRPPRDEINALLSFFYTLLTHDCEAALETVGLDPQVGFFHQERPGRSSLALDMMEELRPYIVDRFVVTLINTRQIQLSDFLVKENGAVFIETEAKKRILQVWQKRKQDVITHPFLKEKIEIGIIPYSQALLMARYLREDLDGYPPFLMR